MTSKIRAMQRRQEAPRHDDSGNHTTTPAVARNDIKTGMISKP
ncbi:hypothetical protein [Rickettsia endosymbiont of Polydrusus tereticollis]